MFNDNLIRGGFSRTVLASAVALAFSQAQANDTPPANQLETVRVIGQAASIDKALVSQKAADNIETTVTSDAIGQLPDTNVSESLQRLPGVSIERDQGEGRFVRVRGLAPDFNAATINGIQTPAPEADRRAVALDVVRICWNP
jgi:TonB-dependent receptor